MRKLLGSALLLFAVPFGVSQEKRPLSEAGIVTCEYPSSGENVGKWVSSGVGFSAAVELRALVTGSGDHRRCVTSWKLHLRENGQTERVLTVAEREDSPDDNEWVQENSFEINGWSKDGQLLLASQIEAQGDWDATTPVVFDFSTSKFWRVDLYPLFKRLIPPGCYVIYRATGFTADGAVLIEPLSTDDDRKPGTKPCFPVNRWRLDFRKNAISRVETKKKD